MSETKDQEPEETPMEEETGLREAAASTQRNDPRLDAMPREQDAETDTMTEDNDEEPDMNDEESKQDGDVRGGKKAAKTAKASSSKYKKTVGTRREVYNGTAFRTSGGLQKKDLFLNKYHRIVSKKKHETAKKEKRLEKYGYFAKKGTFGVDYKPSQKRVKSATKKGNKTTSRKTRKTRQ